MYLWFYCIGVVFKMLYIYIGFGLVFVIFLLEEVKKL